MPYVPLHHKYRPQTFAQLVGQEAIATTLSNALSQERIAPAYLFTGARGTGKTSSARIFAKSLNCIATDKPTFAPCGQCQTCVEITQGNALDVIEIDAASNTGVDNIRELIERAQFAPVQCRYKVYVIDEIHMLSNAAFNCLLKTLEEPPEQVVFVLATTDPQRVLPTIISRCQRFDFRRIPLDAMTAHLSTIAQKEQITIADDAVQLVGQISQGGLRDAESLLDQLSLLEGGVTVESVWDLVGAVPERDLLALVQAIFSDDAEATIDYTRKLMDRGREPLIVLQNLASFYRDLLIAKTAPDRNDLVAVTAPTWEAMVAFAQPLSGKGLLAGQQHLRSAEVQLKNSTQPRLWLEITLMGLLPSAIAPGEAPTAIPVSRPAAVARSVPPAPTPAPPAVKPVEATPAETKAAAPSPPPAPPEVKPVEIPTPPEPEAAPDTSNLDTTWQLILENLGLASTKGIIAPNCFLLEVNGNTVKIGVRGKQVVPLVKAQLDKLSKACAKTLGTKSVKLNLVVSEQAIAPNSSAAPPNPQSAIKKPETPTPTPSKPTTQTPTPKPTQPTPPPASKPPETTAPNNPAADPNAWTPEDPVTRAAKSLADAFNGEIVNLAEEEPIERVVEEDEPIVDDLIVDDFPNDDDPPSINVPF
jgi:DNA polymerase III subunit gamma/tau